MNKYTLTEKEYDVMKILWDSKEPLKVTDIVNITSDEKKLSDQRVQSIIKNLEKKGAVIVAGKVIVQDRYLVKTWKPTITADEYDVMQYTKSVSFSKNKLDAVEGFLCTLIQSSPEMKSDDSFDELEGIVKRLREQLTE